MPDEVVIPTGEPAAQPELTQEQIEFDKNMAYAFSDDVQPTELVPAEIVQPAAITDAPPIVPPEPAVVPDIIKDLGFTHVEFLPVMEHPFFGSWGYQLTGYFAPTSRFGSPEEFMQLVDAFHQEDIGIILDWVPSHFPGDARGSRGGICF